MSNGTFTYSSKSGLTLSTNTDTGITNGYPKNRSQFKVGLDIFLSLFSNWIAELAKSQAQESFIGIPCFSKVHTTPLCFYKTQNTLLFLLTKTNLMSIFTFIKKGEKWKQCWAFAVLRATTEPAHTLNSEGGPPSTSVLTVWASVF